MRFILLCMYVLRERFAWPVSLIIQQMALLLSQFLCLGPMKWHSRMDVSRVRRLSCDCAATPTFILLI
ncbi:hypothetical protein BJ508DRAFT_97026 [Ascobolus immersus RN42]|uniref:Uncharacterized protein n=1 Tax=Ascobolus immersus RN42 TaxID=1160509 RepID=A0A3N4IR15_ASCIM|nr:hypothetical protein BJ508DRAFT_97026 [Ascobolus immersus RN42]